MEATEKNTLTVVEYDADGVKSSWIQRQSKIIW